MQPTSRRRGFTLVELLVVIGIITVLVGLMLPAVRQARICCQRLKATAGVRELLVAYTQHHQAHRGALLPGYTPATLAGGAVVVHDRQSGYDFGLPVADRYPWRLLPYCGNLWAILHSHEDVPPLPAAADSPDDALMKAYMLSLNPTFGLNTVFLGGDRRFGGFVGDRPNTGRHVAFRATDIRRPTETIVFAECQARGFKFDTPDAGMHYLTPPRANGQRWTVSGDRFVVTSTGTIGVPQGRYGRKTVVGFFDGHAEQRDFASLTDMRLWAPRADRPDYDIP